MIISNVTAYVNSYEYNGEVIVPSRVLTSTPQNEELNLAYAPNFQLKLDDSYSYLTVTDTVKVRFSYGSVEYTAYADIINRSANDVVTLQYVDGLSSYNNPEPGPEHELSQQISNILGTSYNVVNDMSEEDALAAANNILYGDEQPPV